MGNRLAGSGLDFNPSDEPTTTVTRSPSRLSPQTEHCLRIQHRMDTLNQETERWQLAKIFGTC